MMEYAIMVDVNKAIEQVITIHFISHTTSSYPESGDLEDTYTSTAHLSPLISLGSTKTATNEGLGSRLPAVV
eukprot:scaffold453_cov187-Ochromonas_danica.AAC.24